MADDSDLDTGQADSERLPVVSHENGEIVVCLNQKACSSAEIRNRSSTTSSLA